ncbi:glycosyltransferase family 4 protein [Thermodesulfobacteriota bacterium]
MVKKKNKLRILQLIYDHPDNPWCGGGGAGRAWAINNILSKKHDITVCCGGFPGARRKDEPYDIRFLGRSKHYIVSRLKFILGCLKINIESYDLVVEEFSYYAPIFLRSSRRPLVTVLQGQHGLKALRYRGIYGLVSLFSEYITLRTRRSVIIVSEHLRSITHPKALVVVIGQGAEVPERLPENSEEYVLYLGRLDIWHKGLDILIEAWSKISSEDKKFPLVIAGGGDVPRIKRLIEKYDAEKISLLGRLTYNEAMDAIRRSAFVCLPSRMEGSPLVLYEAYSLGKPVIGTSIPALKNLIPHGVAGLQVPPDDPEALSKAIISLLNDKLRRRILAEGAEKIGKGYRWDIIAEKQERFYYDVIKRWQENRGE